MQAVVNERLVRRESRIGGALLAVTFSLLLIGFFFSMQQERWSEELAAWAPIAFTYAVVIVGMAFYYLGNARLRRFGPRYRSDGRLREQLKGLDDRYVLYSFLGIRQRLMLIARMFLLFFQVGKDTGLCKIGIHSQPSINQDLATHRG